MRLLVVDHKTVWAGGQVALSNVCREWQSEETPIEPYIVCPPEAALAWRMRAWNFVVETCSLGAIEKTRGVLWNGAQRVVPTWHLLQIIRRTRAELILANGSFSFLSAVFAAKLARLPIVWWDHSPSVPRDRMIRSMLEWANAIVAVSESHRAQLLAIDPTASAKVELIYNGVTTEPMDGAQRQAVRHALGWQADECVIGTLSRLSPEKGIDSFLEAAALVARECASARFLIVGDGPEQRALEQQTAALALTDRVRFVGFQDDPARYVAALDVMLLSSQAEAFSMTVLEALAAACPVVATDVGGVSEQIINGVSGVIVPPRDVGAMAHAVLELLGDANKRRALGDAGRVRVAQHFTLAGQAHQLANLLERVAKQ